MERIDIVKNKIADQDFVIREQGEQLDYLIGRKEQRERRIVAKLKEIQQAKGIRDEFIKELNELQGGTNGL